MYYLSFDDLHFNDECEVRNTGGAIFFTGEARAPPVKQLKNALIYTVSHENMPLSFKLELVPTMPKVNQSSNFDFRKVFDISNKTYSSNLRHAAALYLGKLEAIEK